ncbi:hypothetical protein RF11_14155 [Thelohanellus kitauei]|uniref:Uncharacterized protein n=1 Tax=Thelohanellus kitauei TaxID=669202 RepID=A0A0C2IYU1_THEKT|nr:hypothetical protein RF11_14155 [Thelohanellus kitauei]
MNCESFAFSSKFGYLNCCRSVFSSSNVIWKIDLESLEWFKLDNSLKSRIYAHNMAVMADSILYVFGLYFDVPICAYKLERFMVQPPAIYRLCLETLARSQSERNLTTSVPVSILDELNINKTN